MDFAKVTLIFQNLLFRIKYRFSLNLSWVFTFIILSQFILFPDLIFSQKKSVTVSGFDICQGFSVGDTCGVVKLRFSSINGNARISSINVFRNGNATDSDIPQVLLFADDNQDGIPDGSAISDANFQSGIATLSGMNNENLSSSVDWLIFYVVSPTANPSVFANCTIESNGINGSGGTRVNFGGISTGDQPLPVELSHFTCQMKQDRIDLVWRTESEIENVGFIILRANNFEGPFREIASYQYHDGLKGHFNTNMANEYSYTDSDILSDLTYWYILIDVDINGVQEAHGPINAFPTSDIVAGSMELAPAFPNPFNPSTTIRVKVADNLAGSAHGEISIFNSLGQKVKTIFRGKLTAGNHDFTWNGVSDSGIPVAGGMYFVVLESEQMKTAQKLILLK
jgi:hypothetical protein